jgi:hypothetical protein
MRASDGREDLHMGLKSWQFWTLSGLAGLAILLWLAGLGLGRGIQELQRQANENQLLLNQGERINQLNGQLAQALATAAAQTGDPGIRRLLADNGITFTFTPNAPAAAQEPGDE